MVIGTPRCGGTAYSKMLSEKLNYEFVNEPFNFFHRHKKIIIGKVPMELGGGINTKNNYVTHTIISQYIMEYHNSNPPDVDLILLERKDKWAQLKSFCILLYMVRCRHSHEFHNYNFDDTITINVDLRWIQEMFFEWMLFLLFKENNPTLDIVYYEDINFPKDLLFQQNKGYENITIANIDILEEKYRYFWKYNSNLDL